MLAKPRSIPALIPPLANGERLLRLISHINGRSLDENRIRLLQEYRSLGSTVWQALQSSGVSPYVWSPAMAEFYEHNDAFIFETIVWNLTYAKSEMREWIAAYLAATEPRRPSTRQLSVLTFGDGLGFDSWYLSSLGHQVTYFEVSRRCAEFATEIFNDGQPQIAVVTQPDQLETCKFDVILCLDVLEHVPDPKGLVAWLSKLLVDNGKMIASSPFYLLNRSLGTHLRANRRFSGEWQELFGKVGLTPVSGRLFWNPIVLQKGSPQPIPATIRWGGALLWPGRFWSWPYSVISDRVLQRKHPLKLES